MIFRERQWEKNEKNGERKRECVWVSIYFIIMAKRSFDSVFRGFDRRV